MSTVSLPPVSDMLTPAVQYGYAAVTFNGNPPGTPLNLTYNFETADPTTGQYAGDSTWSEFSPAEMSGVKFALADTAACCGVTFTQVSSLAQINYGNSYNSDQNLMGTSFGKTEVPVIYNPVAFVAFNPTVTALEPDRYEEVAAHELGNVLDLNDVYGFFGSLLPAQFDYGEYTAMAGVNYDYSHNAGSGGFEAVGMQMLDILALQYLYGVNNNGYTPTYPNTAATLAGNSLTYDITDLSSPECIWVGENVATIKCFNFSSCSSAVDINLNSGTFSSNFDGAPQYVGVASGPDNAISIAINTVINVGIGNNDGDTMTADSTIGHNDVMVAGSGVNTFMAGGGTDIFVAAKGSTNTAKFHDSLASYTIDNISPGVIIVTDKASTPTDGTIVLDGNFTSLQFADTTVSETPSAMPGTSVVAPAAMVVSEIDVLQYLVANGDISSIALTGSGIPVLSVTTAQTKADAEALAAITGNFSVTMTASSGDQTVSGVVNALGNTVVFSGEASQYTITAAGDGVHFTVATTGSSDQFSDIQALQFADYTEIVAPTPGSGGTVTGGNITELYGAVFGRVPDVAGLNYYERELASSPALTLTTLAEDFLSSPEYTGNAKLNYAQSSAGDAQFIADCYTNLLNRAPESGAVSYYQNLITRFVQGLTPGTAAYTAAELQGHATVLVDFSASAEFLGDVQVSAANLASAGFHGHWLVLI